MTTAFDVVAEQREWHQTNPDVGGAFEVMMQEFQRTDPMYADRIPDVWMWSDWPGRDGKPDTSIDLVADGGRCAFQCKFHEPNHECGHRTGPS